MFLQGYFGVQHVSFREIFFPQPQPCSHFAPRVVTPFFQSRYLGMSRLEKLQYWLQSHQFEMSLLLVQNRETTVLLLWWVFCVRKRGGVDFVFVEFPLKTNKYSETKNRPGIGRPVVKSQFPSFQICIFFTQKRHTFP